VIPHKRHDIWSASVFPDVGPKLEASSVITSSVLMPVDTGNSDWATSQLISASVPNLGGCIPALVDRQMEAILLFGMRSCCRDSSTERGSVPRWEIQSALCCRRRRAQQTVVDHFLSFSTRVRFPDRCAQPLARTIKSPFWPSGCLFGDMKPRFITQYPRPDATIGVLTVPLKGYGYSLARCKCVHGAALRTVYIK